jgi:hypothetical protein
MSPIEIAATAKSSSPRHWQSARRTSIRDMHKAFQISYVYDYITKSCRQKLKSTEIMKMQMFATLDKAKPDTENIRGLNLAAVMCTTVQVSRLLW